MAECQLPKLDGAGSTPVSRSKNNHAFQDNFKDNQGQKADKTRSTSGTEESDNLPLSASNGHQDTYSSQIKDRHFPIISHNMYITQNGEIGPRLAELIEAWPTLSPEVKRKIIDLIRTARKDLL